jgi:LysR family glycine cleavage system transcriptional activator
MIPTPEAEALAASVRDGLKLIRDGIDGFCGEEPGALVISVMPSFARLWLGPRLAEIGRRFPDMRLDIRSERGLANFVTDGVDLAVRAGDGDWPGLEIVHLAAPAAFPVVSPGAINDLLPNGEWDLTDAALLEPSDPLWSRWLGGARRRGAAGLGSTIFDDAAMVVDAALDGAGVALVRSHLVARLLAQGRLARLQKPTAAPGRSYFAVWPRRSRKAKLIGEFVDWLRAELTDSVARAEA